MKMPNPFRSRSAMSQVNYLRHIRSQVEEGNRFATKLAIDSVLAAAAGWYLDANTKPSVARLLQVEMDLLDAA
jgi:hypothetical protein